MCYNIFIKKIYGGMIVKKHITVRLDENIVNEIERIAKKDNRSLGNTIETILRVYLINKDLGKE